MTPPLVLLVLEGLLPERRLALVGPLALGLAGQPALALVTLLLGEALRTLGMGWRPRQSLALLGTAALTLPAGPWGLVAYPIVAWSLPVLLSAGLRSRRERREAVGLALLAPALAWLHRADPWTPALVLLGLQLLLLPERDLQPALQASEAEREREALERHQLARELQVLEALSRDLAGCASLQASLDKVLAAVLRAVPCESCAVFGEHLEPLAWRTPHASRLHLREPLVVAAWEQRKRLQAGPEHLQGERIFAGESQAVGLYLESGGVLYWGSHQPPSEAQLALLAVIADQASLALLSGRQRDQLAQALAAGESRRLAHQQWVDRLVVVLDGVRELLGAADLQASFAALMGRCVPHTGGEWLQHDEVLYSWGTPVGPETLATPVGDSPLRLVLSGPGFDSDQRTLVGILACLYAVLHERAQSQQQLVQASKLGAVGQLAAGVAHELNTPLGAIGLSLDALRKQTSATALKRVELASSACRQCQEIVEKLLVFCRADHEVQTLNLHEVLAETLLLVRSHLSRARVSLTTELGEVPPVLGRRGDLQQVLTNLIMNAACVARNVTVQTWSLDGQVLVNVKDDGPGMSAEVLARAFEPFFTTKPVGQGTGLGLSISREAMRKMGGDLTLQSRPGEGTTAQVRIPWATPGVSSAS